MADVQVLVAPTGSAVVTLAGALDALESARRHVVFTGPQSVGDR